MATALALVFLVLPAAPVVPVPTVGGYAHAHGGNCDGLRSLVSGLEADLDAAYTGGPHQNNDVVRRLVVHLRLAQESLAECETGCPYPLMFMAAGFGLAATAASVAGVVVPEPVTSGLGLLSGYYGIHSMLWTGMCIYLELR